MQHRQNIDKFNNAGMDYRAWHPRPVLSPTFNNVLPVPHTPHLWNRRKTIHSPELLQAITEIVSSVQKSKQMSNKY